MGIRLAIVVGLLGLVAPARADDDERLAQIHAAAARDYFSQADYEKALKEFSETYRLSKRPAFLYNIAVCHERLGHYDEAIANLEHYLRELPEAGDRGTVEDRIRNLRARHPAATPPSPSNNDHPKAKRPWWVLGVVGGAAVVALAVGLGVGLSGASDFSPTLGINSHH